MASQSHFNPVARAGVLELLAEVAVLISLFAAGLKLSAPLGHVVRFKPFRLATVSMVATAFPMVMLGQARHLSFFRCKALPDARFCCGPTQLWPAACGITGMRPA